MLELIIPAFVILGICVLFMAVGVIFKGKTFTSCGCASIIYQGEKIRCAACPDKDDDPAASKPSGDVNPPVNV